MKLTPPADSWTGSKTLRRSPPIAAPARSDGVADLIEEMAGAYRAELARRRLQTASPQVYEVSGHGGVLVPPGTLVMATGAADDELLADLASAARTGDASLASEVISRIRQVAAGPGRVLRARPWRST